MADSKRLVAISIGVADPAYDRNPPDLPRLRAAINGARSFFEWATAARYDARLVTDENEPVTIARLRAAFEELLPPRAAPAHRLLIYFAGHGFIRDADDALWLLSGWRAEGAVAVNKLRRVLSRYDLSQISIFADACHSLPWNMDCLLLTFHGVLPVREADSREPQVDTFVATQDAASTYAVPGEIPEQDRCIFSGVLLEGLWGQNSAACPSNSPQRIVTGPSLKRYLRSEVPLVANRYNVDLQPSVSTNFDDDDNVYMEPGMHLQPPSFPPWPTVESVLKMGWPGQSGRLKTVQPRARPVRPPAEGGVAFAPPSHIVVYSNVDFAVWMRDGGYTKRRAIDSEFWSLEKRKEVAEGRRTAWLGVAVRFPEIAPYWRPALVEFKDGTFAPVATFRKMTAALQYEAGSGVSEIVFREQDGPPDSAKVVEALIDKMNRGGVRPGDLTKLAKKFSHDVRRGVCIDPLIGVIGAYVYDSVGDLESVRRMAFYYAQAKQAIPYDIAMIANLQPIREDSRGLWVVVPAVSERPSEIEKEAGTKWVKAGTYQLEGLVAGNCPWMRQGWALLDEFRDEHNPGLVPKTLFELREHLSVGRFTTFTKEGGLTFASMLSLSNLHATKPTK